MKLKVNYFNKDKVGGADWTIIEVYFKPEQTGHSAIEQILKEAKLPEGPSTDWILFHAKSALWIKQETTLASIAQDDVSNNADMLTIL
jgi:hypothetical protein